MIELKKISKVPPCRWCKYTPILGKRKGRRVSLEENGLPKRCPNRSCRSPTAYDSDSVLMIKRSKQFKNLKRWDTRGRIKKPIKIKVYFACTICERSYEDEFAFYRHQVRRNHFIISTDHKLSLSSGLSSQSHKSRT